MNPRLIAALCVTIGATWFLCSTFTLRAEPNGQKQSASDEQSDKASRVSIAVARERAAMLHITYAATLDTIHRYYFRKNQAVLPARAMEDVFSEVAKHSKAKARWISVNTKPMSVDHEPEGEFEKQAAAEIAAGKEKYEVVEKGYLRSASSIPLGSGCLSCHAVSTFAPPPKGPRYAGLVISVPIIE